LTRDGQEAIARLDTRAIDRKTDVAVTNWRETIRKHLPQNRGPAWYSTMVQEER
jgi:hypothetical protein